MSERLMKRGMTMKKRALILGGGGTLGIAWEVGLISGLAAHGINLAGADLIVGTSAGAVVGALLAGGVDPQILLHLVVNGGSQAKRGPVDPAGMAAIYAKWSAMSTVDPQRMREIGQMALAIQAIPEAEWVEGIAQLLAPVPDWPDRNLQVTAVDAETGAFTVWTKESGVPLHLAVASSCTVPGLFTPVQINGRRYIDGGVRTSTNADLALGYSTVLVLAPGLRPGHRHEASLFEQERSALQAGGCTVQVVVPDAATLAVFGSDSMDAARAPAVAKAGLAQGQALAQELAAFWSA
jgi:NTE family protein